MQNKYLKVRISGERYEALKIRAAAEGKRLGTYARELLDRETKAESVSEVLARIESVIDATSNAQTVTKAMSLDLESRRVLQEVLLLSRELALDANAQILSRVAAQLIKFH